MSTAAVDRNHVLLVSNSCPPEVLRQGCCLSTFEPVSKIGSGYASTVYLAKVRGSELTAALKTYHKAKLTELNHFQVRREIRIHGSLAHKHIVQLWAAFEDDAGVHLITEYAGRGDVFSDVGKRGGKLRESEAVREVLLPFISALEYIHSRNIVHRDIKPENLFFSADGTLKVADFGLSINVEEERPVTRVGTLDYMAPEVVVCPSKQRPQDHKELTHLHYTPVVDSWAVGVLAYEMIVGKSPFVKPGSNGAPGGSKLTAQNILKAEPPYPAFLSDGCRAFIQWALTKDARSRPPVAALTSHPWLAPYLPKSPARDAALVSAAAAAAELRTPSSPVDVGPKIPLVMMKSTGASGPSYRPAPLQVSELHPASPLRMPANYSNPNSPVASSTPTVNPFTSSPLAPFPHPASKPHLQPSAPSTPTPTPTPTTTPHFFNPLKRFMSTKEPHVSPHAPAPYDALSSPTSSRSTPLSPPLFGPPPPSPNRTLRGAAAAPPPLAGFGSAPSPQPPPSPLSAGAAPSGDWTIKASGPSGSNPWGPSSDELGDALTKLQLQYSGGSFSGRVKPKGVIFQEGGTKMMSSHGSSGSLVSECGAPKGGLASPGGNGGKGALSRSGTDHELEGGGKGGKGRSLMGGARSSGGAGLGGGGDKAGLGAMGGGLDDSLEEFIQYQGKLQGKVGEGGAKGGGGGGAYGQEDQALAALGQIV